MSSRDEIVSWTEEAFHTLKVAQKLTSSAHSSLNSTTELLAETYPSQINDAILKYKQVSEQYASVLSVSKNTQHSVLRVTNGHEEQVANILQPALKNIDTVLADLHKIEVPDFLVKTSEDSPKGSFRLDAFIALDEINILRAGVEIYLSNCEKVTSLLRSTLEEFVQTGKEKSVHFRKLSGTHDSQIVPLKPFLKYAGADVPVDKTPSDLVGTLLKESNSLGSELTSLLEMVTKHYDQCLLASEWVKSGTNEELVDLEVLKNDTEELPEVLNEVRAVCEIIAHNEKRALGLYGPKRPILESFSENCQTLFDWCTEFEDTEVVRLLLMLVEAKTVYDSSSDRNEENPASFGNLEESKDQNPQNSELGNQQNPDFYSFPQIQEYAHTVIALTDHYRQFCAVYQAQYLSELHYEQYVYPRKFLKTLDDFLNGQLLQMEKEEHERRHKWLEKYGQFIPADLVLPGESQFPRVVQVVSEGMEHLEEEEEHSEEERLLKVLRKSSGRP